MKFYLSSPSETDFLADIIASILKRGDVLALSGDLGVGKSSFARALIRAFVGDKTLEVPSPSFALVQPYEVSRGMIYHYDLWRLDAPEHIYELGWDDACEEIMLIEWAEHAREFLPEHAIKLRFSFIEGEEEGRMLVFEALSEEKFHQIKQRFETVKRAVKSS